ncbi:hypothetical protein OH77DRAFT_495396 [Trametes cingulata]|nr:hypothetical protein OH77DRAFT_495396 [Trametes cingulata]
MSDAEKISAGNPSIVHGVKSVRSSELVRSSRNIHVESGVIRCTTAVGVDADGTIWQQFRFSTLSRPDCCNDPHTTHLTEVTRTSVTNVGSCVFINHPSPSPGESSTGVMLKVLRRNERRWRVRSPICGFLYIASWSAKTCCSDIVSTALHAFRGIGAQQIRRKARSGREAASRADIHGVACLCVLMRMRPAETAANEMGESCRTLGDILS